MFSLSTSDHDDNFNVTEPVPNIVNSVIIGSSVYDKDNDEPVTENLTVAIRLQHILSGKTKNVTSKCFLKVKPFSNFVKSCGLKNC